MERRSMRFSLKSKLAILMTGRGWQQGDKLIAMTKGKQRGEAKGSSRCGGGVAW
jgi:hypothetical protein